MDPKEWLVVLDPLDYQEKMVFPESTVHQESKENEDLREKLEQLDSLESPDLKDLQVCQVWLDLKEALEDPVPLVLMEQLVLKDARDQEELSEALELRDEGDAKELLEEREIRGSVELLDPMALLDQ